ncbi:hypothetical protein BU24DRAFT_419584 [Aaosphaeria arxii CBS 175.79]|uniref:Zn(2)-C6 fungal-type domain-containing protein n=1 Tax=Aaosphaeria arxii CBS 175.79 TaxID=1450172 RepID=A0A6A5Y5Z9_9PLEO|nr:uncharacterized protein BU24DRAFT_419584 [Aaosphaeria arxii CBS 175.79]KAF2019984.1 hypothetical protein BU24DRAFT_419584 [Aaosphaeria arxii CBS 175.79]
MDPVRPSEKAPKLACSSCRRRKVRCDHCTPTCGNCLKYGQECIWPNRRQSYTPRKRPYHNLVARLAQMESLVQELQKNTQPETHQSTTEDDSIADQSASTTPSSESGRRSPAPLGMGSNSSPHSGEPFFTGATSETTVGSTVGACSIFSLKGIRKINSLIGDDTFSRVMQSLEMQNLRPYRQYSPSTGFSPAPSNEIVMACVEDFLTTQNHDIRLFQEHEIRSAVQTYFRHGESDNSGAYMAINVILAHSLRKVIRTCQIEEYEKYIHNAMGKLSEVILKKPTPLHIGTLLSTVLYFIFRCENHIAITVLGMAVQLILLSGYHRINSKSGLTVAESLHRRRLFWHAYIVDHDLMLRMGKPPLINEEFLLALPEEHPPDGYGLFYYGNNITVNFFRQQVCLAQLQGKIFSSLYTNTNSLSVAELEIRIAQLDKELQQWYNSTPEMVRPEPTEVLVDADYSRLMCLTTLHFVYFQLIVAIHSAAFRLFAADEGNDAGEVVMPSVALCVSASRAAISLLTYHLSDHPFAIFLLYQVAWSTDILFISIIQNKTTKRAHDDLQLIKSIVSFFETYDSNHQNVFSYHIISALATVASRVLQKESELSSGSLEKSSVALLQPAYSIPENMGTSIMEDNFLPNFPERAQSAGSTLPGVGQSLLDEAGLTNEHQWFTELLDWHIPLDFQSEVWKDVSNL